MEVGGARWIQHMIFPFDYKNVLVTPFSYVLKMKHICMRRANHDLSRVQCFILDAIDLQGMTKQDVSGLEEESKNEYV